MFLSYLNWAGLAPLMVRGYLKSLIAPEIFGNLLLPKTARTIEHLRERTASWLGCTAEQVALVPSTTVGLVIASRSLRWQTGDAVVFNKNDFAANVTPWLKLADSGVEPFHCDDWLSTDNWPQQARMVSISTVDYVTGIEQPWRQVVSEARAKNIWTCVDAIQSAGVKDSYSPDVDFWCAGAQKWLGSGIGLAVLVVSKRVLEQLEPPFPSYLALNEPMNIDSGFMPNARAWEMGWVNLQSAARLHANLCAFEHLGWSFISEQVKKRRDYLHERLLEMNWQVVSCPKRWSGIVSIQPGGKDVIEAMVKDGYQRRIITAHRGDVLRFSAHAFTPMGDLYKAVDWLWTWRRRVAA